MGKKGAFLIWLSIQLMVTIGLAPQLGEAKRVYVFTSVHTTIGHVSDSKQLIASQEKQSKQISSDRTLESTHDSPNPEMLFSALDQGNLETIRRLVDQGVDIHSRSRGGWTPLMYASLSGNLEIARFLLEQGVDVNAYDEEGWTALMLATGQGYLDLVYLLMEQGANVNAQNQESLTALMIAAEQNNLDIARFLVQQGAELNGYEQISHLTPLMWAVEEGHFELAEFLLQSGANVNVQNPYGSTALTVAIIKDRTEIVKMLLDFGADFSNSKDDWTPLRLAVLEGNRKILELLIRHGADLHETDSEGTTIYTMATARGQTELADFLVQLGAGP